MAADGALEGRVLANDDMSAVAAFPDAEVVANIDDAALNVFEEFQVAFLVSLLNLGDAIKPKGNLVEAFGFGRLREAFVHLGPFVVFAFGRGLQVVERGADVTTGLQVFEPQLGVLFLILGGLLKDGRDLLVALFPGLARPIRVFVAGLAFPGESGLKILLGLRSFEFHMFGFLLTLIIG